MTRRPRRPTPRPAEVRRVHRLTPHFVRVTLVGDLDSFSAAGPASHLELFLPERRTFTPRRYDPATGELDVVIFVHGDGPASAWAERVAPGEPVEVTGPGRRAYRPDPAVEWHLLLGDETSLPAIGTVLEALTGGPAGVAAHVLVELGDPADEYRPSDAPGYDLAWVHRRPGQRPCKALEAALRELPFPEGRVAAWFGGEAVGSRRVRRHLLEDRRLDPADVVTRGYWKFGGGVRRGRR